MSRNGFKSYWLVDGVRVNNYQTMKKMVEGGKTGIEVSAAQQQIAEEKRKQQARENAILDDQIRRAAAQREHDQSPEGQKEVARRTALNHPGGIVSQARHPNIAELDRFGPANTNTMKI